MEKTWKPTTAGILSIIAGALVMLGGIIVAVVGGSITGPGAIPMMVFPLVPRIFTLIAVPLIILGAVAVAGGVCALKRRKWGVALAGSICALVPPFSILGILSIIFVALGKGEFE